MPSSIGWGKSLSLQSTRSRSHQGEVRNLPKPGVRLQSIECERSISPLWEFSDEKASKLVKSYQENNALEPWSVGAQKWGYSINFVKESDFYEEMRGVRSEGKDLIDWVCFTPKRGLRYPGIRGGDSSGLFSLLWIFWVLWERMTLTSSEVE